MENLPNDPVILLSVINTKLRDLYPDLDSLCEDLQINKTELLDTLGAIGFEYAPNTNQFR